jgi:integrase
MMAWELPNKEEKHEVEKRSWAGRRQSEARRRPSSRPLKAEGGETTISPPANVKLPAIKGAQSLAYGVDTLVVAIDVRWESSSLFGYEIKRAFKNTLKKAKIENFRFHDLRHSFASSLVQKGVDLYQVQRLLGHKDSRMTQRYAHLSPEDLRDAVLKLDKKEPEKSYVTNLSQSAG